MDKIESTSLNIEKDNIEKLKELFPNAVTEGKINFDVLKADLGDSIDDNIEKYQFTWPGKKASIKLAQTPSSATLRPDKESSKDWDTTENLYIEGDNLEVLKQLQKTYYGQIKMIYIDPPYNTGDDFVYHDDFKDSMENYKKITNQESKSNPETSGRYHTDWLNMMYPRLFLAKNLLTEDGAIFISIDDHELENTIKICKEIYGEDNYVGMLKWKRKKQPSFLGKHIAPVIEYILIFAKNKNKLKKLSIDKVSDSTKKVINISNNESIRRFNKGVIVKGINDGIIKKGKYTVKTMTVEYLNDVIVKNGFSENDVDVKSKFLNTQDKIDDFINNGLLFITKQYGLRRYLTKEENEREKSIVDLITDWGDNQDSEKEQKSIFGKVYFDYTKPVLLIKNLLKSLTDDDDIILDFFSGSATTAQAVMQLNQEDNGSRKFIMVQLPEKIKKDDVAYSDGYRNICEIGKERIRAVEEIIKKEFESDYSNGLFTELEMSKVDFGFKTFKLESSNIIEWDDSLKLEERELSNRLGEVFKKDRNKEDILYEIMLKYGIFDKKIENITVNNKIAYDIKYDDKSVIIYLEDINENDIKEIGKLHPTDVIFNESGFKDDNEKINAIYNLNKAGVKEVKCI